MNEQKRKILIVEDDEITVNIYSVKLKDEGFDVLIASDGQEAWEMIQAGQIPDVIFTGIVMPRLDGFGLIEKLKTDPSLSSISVVMFSHRNRLEDRQRAEQLGVNDFIARDSTTPIEVVRRLKILLGTSHKFKVSILTDRRDGKELISFLNKQQVTSLEFKSGENAILDFEAKPDKGVFNVHLSGEKEPR
ncbi:hypothetical protein A2833_00460 [Candidatus Azambacteria bacterium RIFCSPHIGHO2_01_FULL_44_55]|uniref:Response regulatory domain-containing protein n=1 Tax=Candidatus Azambacteria bacterium RIFCSPLOWO2_02_FULL_44_14 TaxID=1797306 RepID=A0A1F5CAR9_9BACT|nr:MAG: hypothetical protein A3A18_00235 [Candidatus Azambacteria bacterium RIFCSPLOWO2_01_FULL_44_84]OGD33484.1 MAG: hypothetical protein A3C78_00170 [Candidatus Azambacteria bacterium RIFCSPHIGHO2_02_FULL_45_18]OGD39954.1 MAG: hypothetical protein A3I30_01945 [Candidatus Azambacteria bacterium RIFCSPLOWO2_02_FULL_44_14]OGD40939.1 MAG: hypothetical protein A2833_00460 [Candidatus Azambacteria bacterium RIFCSPHIGHO2_01_FULL_44_55]OGD52387.1 MAG: hypothetical protein A2608_02600 [Candidatus Azam